MLATSTQPNACVLWLTGVGLSAVNLSCQVVLQQHFNRNRSIATAVAMTGKSIGLIVGPLLIQRLIDVFGGRGALLVFSAVFLNTFALSLGFRPPRKARKKARGFRAVLRKIFDFSMLTDVTFVLFCTSFMLFKFDNMGFYRQLPSRMVFEGMSRQRAALLLSITGATSVIGRFVSGFVGNWACVSRTLLYALAVLMTGVVTCALVLGTSFVYTSVIAALAGASLGTSIKNVLV